MPLAFSQSLWFACDDTGSPLVDALNARQLAENPSSVTTWNPTYAVSSPIGRGVRTVASTGGCWAVSTPSTAWHSGNYTVAGWVKVDSMPSTFSLELLKVAASGVLILSKNAGIVSLKLTSSSGVLAVSHTLDEADVANWVHIAATVTTAPLGSAQTVLYVDGNAVATSSNVPFWQSGVTGGDVTAGEVYCGIGTTADYSVSGIGWWQRALSAGEVAALAAGAWYPYAGLQAHQLAAEAALSADSSAALAGVRVHQLAAEVASASDASASLAGLRANQLAAEAACSEDDSNVLAGLHAHQLAAEAALASAALYAQAVAIDSTIDGEEAAAGMTADTIAVTIDGADCTPPASAVVIAVTIDGADCTPPAGAGSITATIDGESAFQGARAAAIAATLDGDAAVPPMPATTITTTIDGENAISLIAYGGTITAVIDGENAVPPMAAMTITATIDGADAWHVPQPAFKFVRFGTAKSQFDSQLTFFEETSNRIKVPITCEDKTLELQRDDFEAVLLTLYDVKSGAFLTRTSEVLADVLDIVDGLLTIEVTPSDTDILDETILTGSKEKHVFVVELAHGTERQDALVNPFSVTANSKTVTVNHADHSLEVENHVWFIGSDDVGGIGMVGLYLVTRVVDANTYEVHAKVTPTQTAAGGGTVRALIMGCSNKGRLQFEIQREDVQ